MRRALPFVVALVATALLLPPGAATARGLPHGWPHRFSLGVADEPGHAAALRRVARVGFRYQYLAGGVNTGNGWSTWNPGGSFVTAYVRESLRARTVPVFSYYQLLQSRGPAGADEASTDLAHLHDPALMRAYWADLSLFLRRAGAFRGHLVVLHVEPDLWGYLEQAGGVPLASSFAHHVIDLRNRLAPNVALGWHLSVWGTREDPTYSKPSLAHMRALGARSARFYRALHARFDLVFTDIADRDAGFRQHVLGDGGATWWHAADFRRHDAYLAAFHRATAMPLVVWQIPLGNTLLSDTWDHFRDDRVQWWLGRGGRAHLRAERAAGVVALLFGAGADGCTTAQSDGGLFYRLAAAYERRPLRVG